MKLNKLVEMIDLLKASRIIFPIFIVHYNRCCQESVACGSTGCIDAHDVDG